MMVEWNYFSFLIIVPLIADSRIMGLADPNTNEQQGASVVAKFNINALDSTHFYGVH